MLQFLAQSRELNAQVTIRFTSRWALTRSAAVTGFASAVVITSAPNSRGQWPWRFDVQHNPMSVQAIGEFACALHNLFWVVCGSYDCQEAPQQGEHVSPHVGWWHARMESLRHDKYFRLRPDRLSFFQPFDTALSRCKVLITETKLDHANSRKPLRMKTVLFVPLAWQQPMKPHQFSVLR